MGEGLIEVWGKGMLGGHLKQAIHEFNLILDSSGLDLSLPNPVHRLEFYCKFSQRVILATIACG